MRAPRQTGSMLPPERVESGAYRKVLHPVFPALTRGDITPAGAHGGRLLQGCSAGMELGGVSVYLSEIATPGHKGFYVSWQSASQQAAVMFAALLGVILNVTLAPQAMASWGWRVPLLVGCAII